MSRFLSVAALTGTLLSGWAASAQEPIPLTLGFIDHGHPRDGDPGFAGGETNGGATFVDFAVRLERGKDYFLAGVSGIDAGVGHYLELRDAGGRVLRRGNAYYDGRFGFEFRPAATATYFLRFIETGDPGDAGGAFVGAYAGPDCRSGTTTLCKLRVGQRLRGRWDFLTAGDPEAGPAVSEWDAYKVRLVAGRPYTATLTGSPRLVAFVGADGRVLASTELPPDSETEILRVTFRPKHTGYYWVRTGGSYDSSYYNLLVK